MDYKEKVIALLKSQELSKEQKEKLENIFPELNESEDEKIRKELIDIVAKSPITFAFEDKNKVLAWLEKQGEQKPIDTVEPKFKIGDWITDGDVHCKISDILDDRYIVDTKFTKRSSIPFKYENNYHLWTINDAKNGDFLAVEDKNFTTPFVAIYKERGLDFFNSHCFIGFNENFYEGEAGHSIENIHPATKEQRDLLFQKMKEAGYKWDTEKKELKKIEENSFESDRVEKAMSKAGYEWSEETHQLKRIEENSSWSEEDENMIQALNTCVDTAIKSGINYISFDSKSILIEKVKNWLKSLKDRVQPKQEWYEGDVKINII